MSIEAFENEFPPLGNELSAAIDWLDDTQRVGLELYQDYAIRPSPDCHAAIAANLEESSLALGKATSILTQSGMSQDTLEAVASLLFHEDGARVEKLRAITPGLPFHKLQDPAIRHVTLDYIEDSRCTSDGDSDAFGSSIGHLFRHAAQDDLVSFFLEIDHLHGLPRPIEIPVVSNQQPVPSKLRQSELSAVAKTIVTKVGQFTLNTIHTFWHRKST